MDFPVDLGERESMFVKVHIAITPAKKAQRLVTVIWVADGLPFPASGAIRPIHRDEGVFRQLIQELRENMSPARLRESQSGGGSRRHPSMRRRRIRHADEGLRLGRDPDPQAAHTPRSLAG